MPKKLSSLSSNTCLKCNRIRIVAKTSKHLRDCISIPVRMCNELETALHTTIEACLFQCFDCTSPCIVLFIFISEQSAAECPIIRDLETKFLSDRFSGLSEHLPRS